LADSWLKRYIAGEREAVWTEMQKAGPIPRSTPLEDDVRAVVQETMSRVRRNVDLLISRLHSSGYQFVDPATEGCPPRTPLIRPDEDSPAFAEWLEALVGPLPASIIGWIVHVGDVNLVGNHPDWPARDLQTDALVVEFEFKGYADREGYNARDYFRGELQAWTEDVAEYGAKEVGPFLLPFAPDSYHKINVSGGAPYAIYVPDASADATCCIDGRDIQFIDYLRDCFSCGGFPGAPSLPLIAELRRDLLPI
jgi:hypothetical protein